MDLLNEVREGLQWMLVKLFARKVTWLKFAAVNNQRLPILLRSDPWSDVARTSQIPAVDYTFLASKIGATV